MTDKLAEIRRLNDPARTRPEAVNCTWVITRGLAHLLAGEDSPATPAPALFAPERVALLRDALANFDNWPEGNDPYHEHDFGAFELFGAKLFWKIDYLHPDHDTHAPEPANIDLCRRVLTIMLAEEY